MPHLLTRDRERLQTLYELNDILKQAEADGLDIAVILPRVLQVAAMELKAHTGSIVAINPHQEAEYIWVLSGESDAEQGQSSFFRAALAQGIAGLAIRDQKVILIADTTTDGRWLRRPDHPTSHEAWSAICAPLIVRGRSTGAITLTTPGAGQFQPDDSYLLQAIASQAASTIENARLYAEVQRQLSISNLLNQTSRVINASLDLNEILRSLLTHTNELLNAEAISIALVDEATGELVYTVAEGAGSDKIIGLRLPASQGIASWVLTTGEPALVNTPQENPHFMAEADRRTGHTTRAILCAPLVTKGRSLGTIQAINPARGRFIEQDLFVLVNLANLTSSAIANAQQFQRTQAAEARYLRLFEDNIDSIILTDLSGNIVDMNRHASDFLGYERRQLLGRPINMLHMTEIFHVVQEHLNQAPDDIQIITSRAQRRDGVELPVEVHIKRTLTLDAEVLQWIYRDIARQIELEQMRTDLTAMLMHDLQDPLSNIISSLEMVDMDLPADIGPTIPIMLDVAKRSSQRLRHMIRSLLDINQLEAGNFAPERAWAEMEKMAGDIEATFRPLLQRRDIALALDIAPQLPPVYINPDMMQRVLINLVDNALKFSKAGQRIILQVQIRPDQKELRLEVRDQGPGVPPKYRQAIFNKFFRAPNNPTRGIGLGLAFCRLAVESHGGQIWVEDAPEGGASFVLTLPTSTPAETI